MLQDELRNKKQDLEITEIDLFDCEDEEQFKKLARKEKNLKIEIENLQAEINRNEEDDDLDLYDDPEADMLLAKFESIIIEIRKENRTISDKKLSEETYRRFNEWRSGQNVLTAKTYQSEVLDSPLKLA